MRATVSFCLALALAASAGAQVFRNGRFEQTLKVVSGPLTRLPTKSLSSLPGRGPRRSRSPRFGMAAATGRSASRRRRRAPGSGASNQPASSPHRAAFVSLSTRAQTSCTGVVRRAWQPAAVTSRMATAPLVLAVVHRLERRADVDGRGMGPLPCRPRGQTLTAVQFVMTQWRAGRKTSWPGGVHHRGRPQSESGLLPAHGPEVRHD